MGSSANYTAKLKAEINIFTEIAQGQVDDDFRLITHSKSYDTTHELEKAEKAIKDKGYEIHIDTGDEDEVYDDVADALTCYDFQPTWRLIGQRKPTQEECDKIDWDLVNKFNLTYATEMGIAPMDIKEIYSSIYFEADNQTEAIIDSTLLSELLQLDVTFKLWATGDTY